MPVKTDRNDARGIAQLMRLGWFRLVHCESLAAQETRALLTAHAALLREFDMFEKRVRAIARQDKRVRLIMSAPGVGVIVALTYVSAIDDPSRFSSSKRAGTAKELLSEMDA
jgi:transposase